MPVQFRTMKDAAARQSASASSHPGGPSSIPGRQWKWKSIT
jgi:hypothetical protein